MVGTGMSSNAYRVRIEREFLDNDGVLPSAEGLMSIVEIRAYAAGRGAS